jgi:transcriptional/translational regulatory protein YebC/TACO1
MEIALEAGADDLSDTGDVFEVLTSPERFADVKEALECGGVPTQSAEVSMVPQSTVDVVGRDADANLKLLEALDDADDVQSVAANVQISQDDLERLGAAG